MRLLIVPYWKGFLDQEMLKKKDSWQEPVYGPYEETE